MTHEPPTPMGCFLWVVALCVVIIAWLVVGLVRVCHARDPDGRYANSPLHDWYEAQHNSIGGWCCNEADGHAYFGDYTVNEDGSVTIGNEKIDAYKVLKGANPTGHAVWWYTDNAYGRNTYCFIAGPLT